MLSTVTYDAANQQLTLGNKSATFDANGNLATLTDPSGTTTYTWNARNQLISLSGPGVTASFQYDVLGRRKSKTVNGATTEFLYDGHTTVQELSGGSVQANLLLGMTTRVCQSRAAWFRKKRPIAGEVV
jgi:YD repeat-containing protein